MLAEVIFQVVKKNTFQNINKFWLLLALIDMCRIKSFRVVISNLGVLIAGQDIYKLDGKNE